MCVFHHCAYNVELGCGEGEGGGESGVVDYVLSAGLDIGEKCVTLGGIKVAEVLVVGR